MGGNRTKNASEKNATVCNVDQEGKPELQEIVNKPAASLHVCKECDACISSRVKYEGYSLKRHNGNNVYSWVNIFNTYEQVKYDYEYRNHYC